MKTLPRLLLTALLVALTYFTISLTFTKGKHGLASLGILLVASAAAGWLQRDAPRPAGAGTSHEPTAQVPQGWVPFILGLGAVAVAFGAKQAMDSGAWGYAAMALVVGAVLWRTIVPGSFRGIATGSTAKALALIILVAFTFRFYKAGDIPVGMTMIDEPRLKIAAERLAFEDKRPPFMVWNGVLADGVVPFYLQAIGVRAFGVSLKGYRMSGVIIGTLIALIIFGIAWARKEVGLGLAAAFLWGVCVWPVSISRAHYLMVETHLVVLSAVALLLIAIRRPSMVLFGLAGFFWALNFNAYNAAQVMLAVVPWLLMLIWLFRPEDRPAILRGLPALVAGLLIGLSPLLIWAYHEPGDAFKNYFGVLYANHTAGTVGSSGGFFARMDTVLARTLPEFRKGWSFFSLRGPAQTWYMPTAYPVFMPLLAVSFLAGVSVCLARFREPLLSFLLFWWVAGLLPGLSAVPALNPDDRRLMMSLPPFLFIAGTGALAVLDVLVRPLRGPLRSKALWLLIIGFGAFVGAQSWHDYFHRNQKDAEVLGRGRANAAMYGRAVFEEVKKEPAVVISTKQDTSMVWTAPSTDSFAMVFVTLNPGLPLKFAQKDMGYYQNKGLCSLLRWGAAQSAQENGPDVLVTLSSFHYYLEPLLLRLGGRTVREVPMVYSSTGPCIDDIGMAPAQVSTAKLIRFDGLKAQQIDQIEAEDLYHFSGEQLRPSVGWTKFREEYVYSRATLKLLEEIERTPRRWPVEKKVAFDIPDPWFWTVTGQLPGELKPPYRLRLKFDLLIEEPGDYALGASSSMYARILVDGKEAFRFLPENPEIHDQARAGILGSPMRLGAGKHRVEVEQVCMSRDGNYNQLLRVVWRRPGGALETLPLESMRPVRF